MQIFDSVSSYNLMEGGFSVPWSGYYVDNYIEEPFAIENLRISTTGEITGAGVDLEKSFDIKGAVNPQGGFQFIKQYEGAHAVSYKGTVSDGCLSGVWSCDGNKGDFKLDLDCQRWKGSLYIEDKDTYALDTAIYVSENGVFGVGVDEEGPYVIGGTYDPSTNKISLLKSYIDRYCVLLEGSIHDDGEYLLVIGTWKLRNGDDGSFELYQKIEDKAVEHQQFYQAPLPPQDYAPTFFGLAKDDIPIRYTNIQGQGPDAQLAGLLDDLDLHGGDTDEVRNIMDKLNRGKQISGKQLATFIPMVRDQDDFDAFLQSLNENKVQVYS